MEEIKIVLLGAAGVWTAWRIGRAVKNRICQWTENRVREQHEGRLPALTEDLHKKEWGRVGVTSTKLDPRLESPETEPDFRNSTLKMKASHSQRMEGFLQQKLKQERTKIRLEREEHQEEIAALKSLLERNTILAQENATALLWKLSQEEALRQELEAKENEQIKELLERLQRTEKSEHFAKVENEELKEKCKEFQEMSTKLAEELGELKINVEQERNIQQTEIQTLQEKLDMMTCLMQERETIFQQKVAEEEAKTAQANAKFAAYKKELARFNREHQNYLKEKAHREAQEKQKQEESSSQDCYY